MVRAIILPSLLVIVVLLLVVVAVISVFAPDADIELDGMPQFIASSLLYLGLLVVLIAGRGAFRVPRRSKRRLATGTSQRRDRQGTAAAVGAAARSPG